LRLVARDADRQAEEHANERDAQEQPEDAAGAGLAERIAHQPAQDEHHGRQIHRLVPKTSRSAIEGLPHPPNRASSFVNLYRA
jgi:hypothetical protein